jgi:predicted transposase YbfD/YdcC
VVPGAAEAIALHKNHIDMVKFKSEDDHGFKVVADQIDAMVRNAAVKIKNNWDRIESK